ncbi:MAG: hypothetical protein KatS3mg105_1569 [Gemmatales bacterium]|nr:MAG: hypothetical protein KatS3mg105_1569 [Gemmatales bacterium]
MQHAHEQCFLAAVCRCIMLFAVAGMVSPAARSQQAPDEVLKRVTFAKESAGVLRQLSAIDQLIADRQWPEAVDQLQRLLHDGGDNLVPIDAHWRVTARRLCQQRLATLPADGLKWYRQRVDPIAANWLKHWQESRECSWLWRIVDEAFCSRAAERALDILGDLAFEEGRFHEAEYWWRHLSLPSEEATGTSKVPPLLYPNAKDPARAWAKQLLARIFRGDDNLREAIEAFASEHGDAGGRLAGRQGKYVDILRELAKKRPAPFAATSAGGWPTLAGSSTRQYRLVDLPSFLKRPAPLAESTWSWSLADPSGGERPFSGPYFYPVVVGDWAFVADARRVRAFNLHNGKEWRSPTGDAWYDLILHGKRQLPADVLRPHNDTSFSLTAVKDRIFVRLGSQRMGRLAPGEAKAAADTFLVCLDVNSDDPKKREIWSQGAKLTDLATHMFEGCPVVWRDSVLIAVSEFQDGSTTSSIACYDAETGAPRWRKPAELCQVSSFADHGPRYRHHDLTWAGNALVYATHSGAIVAIHPGTGKLLWARRYQSATNVADFRAAGACLYARKRLFVAPADSDRVLCLDPESGRLLWESLNPIQVVHLLGVAADKLIVTTAKDIRAISILTGQTIRDWIQPADGVPLKTSGRGMHAAGRIWWSTVAGLRVLDANTGKILAHPFNAHRNELRGNLVAASDCLLVADNARLRVYAPSLWREPLPNATPANESNREMEVEAGSGQTLGSQDFPQSESATNGSRHRPPR